MDSGLQHDCAVVMAQAILEIVAPCLREEEKRDAWEEFYHVALVGIESFVIQRNREIARTEPSMN